VDKPIVVKIKTLSETRDVKLKGRTVLGFNAIFTSNVFIPKYIGLGKSASLGFGVVTQPKNRTDQQKVKNTVINNEL
jgi:hypothetical protein